MAKNRKLISDHAFTDHVTKFSTISWELYEASKDFPVNHVPSPTDPGWLPVDEVLIRLAGRTVPPMLRSESEKSLEATLVWRHRGIHELIRSHLSYAFQRVAGADPDYRQFEIDNSQSYIDHAGRLKNAALDFLESQSSDNAGLPTFASTETAEETARRFRVASEATALLSGAIKRVTEIEGWAWEKYDKLAPPRGGKPRIEWKHEFVICLAQTWNLLTGKSAPAGPSTMFADLVEASWASSGEDLPETSWEATIRAVCSKPKDDKTAK